MAMTYNSLIAAKGTSGAIATWVNYSLLDVQTVLAEAQTLIYQTLRTREMRVSQSLTLNNASNTIALPGASTGQFLEPVALTDVTDGITFIPNDERFVSEQRLLQIQTSPLASGIPGFVAVFDEAFNFDVKASGAKTFTLVFYKMPDLLSSGNQSNWLTNRYPQIVRAACQAASADFMKDNEEYQKAFTRLQELIQKANEEAALLESQGIKAGINKAPAEGSLLSFIPTTSTPVDQALKEAQQLLYSMLRCREMMTDMVFTMPVNSTYQALPARFLDPIGSIQTASFNSRIRHKDSNYIQSNRNYSEQSGTLGTNPFTTASGSTTVSVNLANHGFTQDSIFNSTGAATFNGVTLNGTFPINGITDANNFTIDISILGATPSSSGAGGGAAVNFLCDILTAGTPYFFGIYNERINFEQAFFQTTLCRLQYFQSLPLLTTQDQTNFLTNRYPQLFRIALQAAAANMARDRKTYDGLVAELTPLVMAVNAENEMVYRGMELDPWIP